MSEDDFPQIVRTTFATVALACIVGFVLALPTSFSFFYSRSPSQFVVLVLVFVCSVFSFYCTLLYIKDICRDLKKYAVFLAILFLFSTYFSYSFSAHAKFDNKTFHPNAKRCAWIFNDDMNRELNAFYLFSEKSVIDKIGMRIFADLWLRRDIIEWKVHEISSGINNANIRIKIVSNQNNLIHDVICFFEYWDFAEADFYPNRFVRYAVSGDDRTHLYSSTFFDPIRR